MPSGSDPHKGKRFLSSTLLGSLFGSAGALADHIVIEQHMNSKMLVVIGAAFGFEVVKIGRAQSELQSH